MKILAAALVAAFVVSGVLFAQGYPLPSSGVVTCVTCPPPSTGLSLVPVPASLTFRGRIVDSTLTRDYQQPLRTLRAFSVRVAADRGRVYAQLGSTFAAYRRSTFPSRLGTLASVGAWREGQPSETYLPWDTSFYAEQSAWFTPTSDGQDRLYAFDFDDRGYVYLAYSAFGWGVLRDNGESLASVVQVRPPRGETALSPTRIQAFRSGGRYYVAVGSDCCRTLVFDVTVPSSLVFVRSVPIGAEAAYSNGCARLEVGGESRLAFVSRGELQLVRGADLVAPGVVAVTVISGTHASVTTDGERFYAAEAIAGTLSITTVSADGVVTRTPFPGAFVPTSIRYGAGYLGVTGNAPFDARLFRVAGSTLAEVSLGGFFGAHYYAPPAGFAKPPGYNSSFYELQPLELDGRVLLAFSNHGLGDVYELATATAPAGPLDVDGNGSVDALTDGLLVMRYLFAFRGEALVTGALGPGATRTTPTEIEAYIVAHATALDVDDNGRADALTDGLLILRYLFGFRGDALVDRAIGAGSRRTTAADVAAHLVTLM